MTLMDGGRVKRSSYHAREFFIVIMGFYLISCQGSERPRPEPPSQKGAQAQQENSTDGDQDILGVVYGKDNRLNIADVQNEKQKEWGQSVAAMMLATDLSVEDDDLLISSMSVKERHSLCEGEPFADEISASNCTGFLVEPDLIATAGHCVEDEVMCRYAFWVFGYDDSSVIDSKTAKVPLNNVYSCKKVIEREVRAFRGIDYALIRLDRPVKGRKPLPFRKEGRIKSKDKLVLIGFPSGVPMKVSAEGKIRENDQISAFRVNLDSFSGNSGSPVINQRTGEVEGLLIRGDKDFTVDTENVCQRVNRCEEDGCAGETVTRITAVDYIQPGGAQLDDEFSWLELISNILN